MVVNLTENIIADLQATLRGEISSIRAEQESERYYVGSVWFGDWFSRADKGRFGTPVKSNHNAAISRRFRNRPRMILAPITTRHDVRHAVPIPRGTIPGGSKFTTSYLLPRIKLQASRKTLDTHFQYRCRLSEQIVQDMVAMMKGAS